MIDVLGPEKRRRRTTQEKIAIVQQSFEPGMTVSLVARQHGVAVLEPTQNGFLLDVRLEREVRAAGYTGVSPTGREQCPLFLSLPSSVWNS